MTTVADVADFLARFAPPGLAEDWDNVGLLLGRETAQVESILTCLTLTPDVAQEAIAAKVQLIVSHHPILFRPVQQLTSSTIEGDMILDLVAAGVSVHSPHTSYDSAAEGINEQLARAFGLSNIDVLRPRDDGDDATQGAGRFGDFETTISLDNLVSRVKQTLGISALQLVGSPDDRIDRLGIACGAAAEFLTDAHRLGCQALLTGEARFHDCLAARSLGMAIILPGHYASERPAVEQLAEVLGRQFPELLVRASENESDPISWG